MRPNWSVQLIVDPAEVRALSRQRLPRKWQDPVFD